MRVKTKCSEGTAKVLAAICSSNTLEIGGVGVRFEVADQSVTWPAFVVRHTQGVAAYVNRCAHLTVELDWDPGHFFDVDQRHLICSTHGALYSSDTGECVSGPCNGSRLEALRVVEIDGNVYLNDPRYVRFCRETKD